LNDWCKTLINERLKNYIIPKVQSICDRTLESFTEKSIQLEFDIPDLRVDTTLIKALDASLPHLIRKAIVENNGGRVELNSTFGEDTEIKLIFS
jgi:chemotaxis protein histidine kinase CheA